MERTLSLTIFTAFALVGVALIVLFLNDWKDEVQGGICVSELCTGKVNGETFCNKDKNAMLRCVIDDNGCLTPVTQVCACDVNEGVAYCS